MELLVWWKSLKGGGGVVGRVGYSGVLISTILGVSDLQPVNKLVMIMLIAVAHSRSAGGAAIFQRGAKPHVRVNVEREGRRSDL